MFLVCDADCGDTLWASGEAGSNHSEAWQDTRQHRGDLLVTRPDDQPESVERKLRTYFENVDPIFETMGMVMTNSNVYRVPVAVDRFEDAMMDLTGVVSASVDDPDDTAFYGPIDIAFLRKMGEAKRQNNLRAMKMTAKSMSRLVKVDVGRESDHDDEPKEPKADPFAPGTPDTVTGTFFDSSDEEGALAEVAAQANTPVSDQQPAPPILDDPPKPGKQKKKKKNKGAKAKTKSVGRLAAGKGKHPPEEATTVFANPMDPTGESDHDDDDA